jgi:hypothetical protein
VLVPPPLYSDGAYGIDQAVVNGALPRLVPAIGAALGLPAEVPLLSSVVASKQPRVRRRS